MHGQWCGILRVCSDKARLKLSVVMVWIVCAQYPLYIPLVHSVPCTEREGWILVGQRQCQIWVEPV